MDARRGCLVLVLAVTRVNAFSIPDQSCLDGSCATGRRLSEGCDEQSDGCDKSCSWRSTCDEFNCNEEDSCDNSCDEGPYDEGCDPIKDALLDKGTEVVGAATRGFQIPSDFAVKPLTCDGADIIACSIECETGFMVPSVGWDITLAAHMDIIEQSDIAVVQIQFSVDNGEETLLTVPALYVTERTCFPIPGLSIAASGLSLCLTLDLSEERGFFSTANEVTMALTVAFTALTVTLLEKVIVEGEKVEWTCDNPFGLGLVVGGVVAVVVIIICVVICIVRKKKAAKGARKADAPGSAGLAGAIQPVAQQTGEPENDAPVSAPAARPPVSKVEAKKPTVKINEAPSVPKSTSDLRHVLNELNQREAAV